MAIARSSGRRITRPGLGGRTSWSAAAAPWTQKAVLAASDATTGAEFGHSVAIDGDWAIVGTRWRGAAYVFRRDSATGQWSQFARIADPEPQTVGTFGASVSISGGRAIVGRLTDKCFDQGPGAAYVYEYDRYAHQWLHAARLVPRDSVRCGFGRSVSISGDRAIVTTGAPGYGGDAGYDFVGYLFVRGSDGTWTDRERFAAGRTFAGEAASVSRAGIVLGSASEEEQGARSGAVYLSEMRTPENVTASDGSFDGLVHIEWNDRSRGEEGFIVYRDGVEYANVDADEEFYDDTQAQPGRTYEYSVATVSRFNGLVSERVSDYGWRPPNGHITGRITARTGAGVEGVSVCLEPPPTRALLFDGRGGHVRIPDDGTFNFSATRDFSVEVWFSYSGTDRTPRLISKPPETGTLQRPLDLGLQRSGRLFFTLSDGVNVARVLSRRSDLSDDAWHRVACVHDARSRDLVLYIDGALEDRASTAGLGRRRQRPRRVHRRLRARDVVWRAARRAAHLEHGANGRRAGRDGLRPAFGSGTGPHRVLAVRRVHRGNRHRLRGRPAVRRAEPRRVPDGPRGAARLLRPHRQRRRFRAPQRALRRKRDGVQAAPVARQPPVLAPGSADHAEPRPSGGEPARVLGRVVARCGRGGPIRRNATASSRTSRSGSTTPSER